MIYDTRADGESPRAKATEILFSEVLSQVMADATETERLQLKLALSTEHRSEEVHEWLTTLMEGVLSVAVSNGCCLANLVLYREDSECFVCESEED